MNEIHSFSGVYKQLLERINSGVRICETMDSYPVHFKLAVFFSNSLEDVPEIGLSLHISTLTMT